jgi:hypothetical protein
MLYIEIWGARRKPVLEKWKKKKGRDACAATHTDRERERERCPPVSNT